LLPVFPALALACGLACSAAGGGGPSGEDPIEPGPVGGGGSGGGGAATGGTDGMSMPNTPVETDPPGDPTALCAASEAGAPVLRRLNRREMENTLRDVFPVLGAAWRSTLS